jgi:sec-independent protein translocase protein TatB
VFDVGLPEIAVLIVAALFVFGPDRLPSVVAQAARTIRQIRNLAAGARAEINDAIGPEMRNFNAMAGLGEGGELNGLREEFGGMKDIRDLSPRKILNNAMFGADDTISAPVADPVQAPTDAAGAPEAAAGATTEAAQPHAPAVFDADAT